MASGLIKFYTNDLRTNLALWCIYLIYCEIREEEWSGNILDFQHDTIKWGSFLHTVKIKPTSMSPKYLINLIINNWGKELSYYVMSEKQMNVNWCVSFAFL